MKRYVLLIGVMLSLPLTVLSEEALTTCADGHGNLVKGNTSGTYCKSKITMNWWSAHAWCQSIGGEMIDLTEDCTPNGGNTSTVQCPNLANLGITGGVWTRNVPNNSQAYVVFYAGAVDKVNRINSNWDARVLCRMKTTN